MKLERQLGKALPDVSIKSLPTKYAGHAEELVYELATSHKKPLIISSSGDGGYHEVINGAMKAKKAKKVAITAVLPAGNANDHSRTMQERPLAEAIIAGKITAIDLLEVTIHTKGKKLVRYAHSYAGLGLTPVIATELNRHTLNAFRETWLVLTTFFKHRPFTIRHSNKLIILDSLIFTNINEMAKILTLAQDNKPDDGKFEVISFPHAHKFLLIKKLFRAATVGLQTTRRENTYSFEVIKKMPLQLDGEVTTLAAGARVKISAAPMALKTII